MDPYNLIKKRIFMLPAFATNCAFTEIVRALRKQIGAQTIAYIVHENTLKIDEWVSGESVPYRDQIARLEYVYQAIQFLQGYETIITPREWMLKPNKTTHDFSPAEALHRYNGWIYGPLVIKAALEVSA
jgi:hypothetical protein